MARRFLRFSPTCLLAVSLATATSGFGQTYNQQPYYAGRDDNYRGRPAYQSDATRQDRALFDRTRMDLDHAAGYPYASRADRKRFDEARRELFDFESRFDQGRYEKRELDEAISRLERVVEQNSLDPRDRGALSEDLRRMRDYREYRSHAGWR